MESHVFDPDMRQLSSVSRKRVSHQDVLGRVIAVKGVKNDYFNLRPKFAHSLRLRPEPDRPPTPYDDSPFEDICLYEPRANRSGISNRFGFLFRTQIRAFLETQEKKCSHYETYFRNVENLPMSRQFAALAATSNRFIKLLNEKPNYLPKTYYSLLKFSASPINPDIIEGDLQLTVLIVRLSGVKPHEDIKVSVEFEHPSRPEPSLKNRLLRWYNNTRIEPKALYFTLRGRQYASRLIEDFYFFDSRDELARGNKIPITLYLGDISIERRKFNKINLFFYRIPTKTFGRRLTGCASFSIDMFNEVCTIEKPIDIYDREFPKHKLGRAMVRVKIREPLYNRTPRPLEERILCFS